jgi:hypothetical protein
MDEARFLVWEKPAGVAPEITRIKKNPENSVDLICMFIPYR